MVCRNPHNNPLLEVWHFWYSPLELGGRQFEFSSVNINFLKELNMVKGASSIMPLIEFNLMCLNLT